MHVFNTQVETARKKLNMSKNFCRILAEMRFFHCVKAAAKATNAQSDISPKRIL